MKHDPIEDHPISKHACCGSALCDLLPTDIYHNLKLYIKKEGKTALFD